ncbi:MAG: sigma-70 family RNA polymerase sigma factor [Acidobacteria bacterium]|nr:sigma-70 family RNA polymerase sigma factor [Acidobacteriota bacterium]NIM61706.1 sigma-70 family RNA polymerase sigma factor [Acidobacteriota bacterium]NIO58188.1 sigma-70 family RNA polymerase sigma factor [Acidobacteriota bacterium]NIQ83753.1 sigma-70 family RNA polymerase sigma factor [Acidobacteriota bacterium]NIT09916.1 sigma-70 family RNA polymerase sigma factor [Acidobacteriota bacterium]
MPIPEEAGVLAITAQDSSSQIAGLVNRAVEGDFSAYERLYHRHVGRIFALCLRMTADPATAEDLTQQAFIRGWERLDTFRGESQFAAWLRRIAVNIVLSDRRSRGRRPEHPVEDVETVTIERVARPTASEGIDLERAIAELPPRARAVFVLHDVEGYKHDEIATLLDIAAGTSKTQLHRARRLLREALKP